MKCVQNPMTDDMKRISEAEARRLVSYGWRYVSKSAYKAWQVSQAASLLSKNELPYNHPAVRNFARRI